MQNGEARITSVDRALALLLVLRERGRVGVSEAADSLEVAPSTAHRLLNTLVARGFAVQGPGRQYYVGPEAGVAHGTMDNTFLAHHARPHLEALHARTTETVHLAVRTGTDIWLLDGIESTQRLKVGLCVGARMPGYVTSSGKAMFAALDWSEVEALHARGLADWPTAAIGDLGALRDHLEAVREAGYAINDEETEAGVVVVGASMQDDDGRPIAALTIAAPRDRWNTQGSDQTVAALLDARHACERALRAAVRT